jgi:hypothetical protein
MIYLSVLAIKLIVANLFDFVKVLIDSTTAIRRPGRFCKKNYARKTDYAIFLYLIC